MTTSPMRKNINQHLDTDQEPLDRIKEKHTAEPEVAAQIQRARQYGIAILLTTTLPENVFGEYNHSQKKISLNHNGSDLKLTSVLLHEMRHMDQHRMLMATNDLSDMTMQDYLPYMRLIEGDAFAYETMMVQRFSKKHGVNMPSPGGIDISVPNSEANTMRVAFNLFQRHIADIYDTGTMEWHDQMKKLVDRRPSISKAFNSKAIWDVFPKDPYRIITPSDGIPYLNGDDTAAMHKTLFEFIEPAIKTRLAAMQEFRL